MKIVTSTIEGTAKITWMPRASKKGSSQPPKPNKMTAASPTVTGDSANGRSTSAFSSDLPTKRWRTSTQAVITPKNVVTATVITVITPVRKKACCTSGRENVSTTFDQPGSRAV